MRVQQNITAMNSYRNYTVNNSKLGQNLEKLSSGFRINRAGDDAAGLAISEKMRAQITGNVVAQKNANDGISLVQTAEGALTEVHDMLSRMYELAEQSANGTYDDDVDRPQMQKEVEQLQTEIDRISVSANFNSIQLLDGSLAGMQVSTTVTGGFENAFAEVHETIVAGQELEGLPDELKDLTVPPDGASFNYTVSWNEGGSAKSATFTFTYHASDGTLTGNSGEKYDAAGTTTLYGHRLYISGGIVDGITEDSTYYEVNTRPTAHYDRDYPAFTSFQSKVVKGKNIQAAILSELQKDSRIASQFTVSANGKGIQFRSALSGGTPATITSITTSTINEDLEVALTDAETFTTSTEVGTSLILQIGDTSESFNKLVVAIPEVDSDSLGLGNVNISTQAGAADAADRLKTAINIVSDVRGTLGAAQNRLEHTIQNLSVMRENLQKSESVIRDTDVAEEMLSYTKNGILNQTAQAMLAQANQLPQSVLQLLQ